MKFFSLSLLIFALSATYAQNAEQIIRKMEEKMRGESAELEMRMQIIRPRYTRIMQMKTWAKGQDYSLVIITDPARDRGTAFLKRKKEIWNYVPNVDRTIKLPPNMMSQSWMGSDFTNDDLVRESSVIDDFDQQLMGTDIIDGTECFVLELIPKPGSSVVFSKVKVWIGKEDYLHRRSENYGDKGELVSVIQNSNIRNLGGRMIPTRIEIIPQGKSGHKTVIEYLNGQFNRPIRDDFFSLQNLKNFR
ncbi:outer membrane lipoprotein-sorting protein [Schleiferia thermophila]|jgi:outer membrane lipoprotein-sorting protein|uniref:Outer membrane lipoprotein-sorting protein n=1 Tax=Schleiferia thermophila TaxID=884107 RepID=A0A369A313_9FLAO|nr:outer membrane lipoprotein-sorting protein [Schleiferia thermophila]KFD38495.1 membrane protein [Schleiferia thermophila str. Yellowstone]RCX03599.1 outer membrane lipoprotein-sorting protein [Schleiferia thermophila]GCD79834.1 outer membrane lipoprotein-sorting protein [Schleiferia thermophila]